MTRVSIPTMGGWSPDLGEQWTDTLIRFRLQLRPRSRAFFLAFTPRRLPQALVDTIFLIMVANSAYQSSEMVVKGESEVEAWLQSLPNDWPPLEQVKMATKENIGEALNDFISYYLQILLFSSFGPRVMSVKAPPILLRDALFDNVRVQKKVRKDIGHLLGRVTLARLLLLACIGMSFRFSYACIYGAVAVACN